MEHTQPPTDNSYTFEPIDSDSIRLVKFSKAEDGTIHGELRSFVLSPANCPTYRAVSYFCGFKTLEHTIALGESKMFVLSTLYPFIEMVCDLNQVSAAYWWWIDSICIDEKNARERNNQVAKMHEIYREARKTIIWLGEESDDSDKAMGFLRLLRDWRWDLGRDQELSREFRRPKFKSKWKALENLLLRPWWRRAWTLQEFIVSTRAEFYCGTRRIGRSDFVSAIYSAYLCNMPDDKLLSRKAYDAAWNRRRLLQWYDEFGAMPLVGLMAYMGDLEATDMKDQIYSLLGLVTTKDKDEVVGKPEYGSSLDIVYTKLVKSFYETYQSLDIICLAHIFNHHARMPTTDSALPTWVPDWRARIESHVVPLMVSQSARHHIGNFRPLHSMSWNAVFEASGKEKPRVRFSHDLREIEVYGVLLDFVDGLGGLKKTDGYRVANSGNETASGHVFVQSTSLRNQPIDVEEIGDRTIHDTKPYAPTLELMRAISKSLVLDRADKYLSNAMPEHFIDDFVSFCIASQTQPQDVNSWFVEWFETNKELRMKGQSLRSTISPHSAKDLVMALRDEKLRGAPLDGRPGTLKKPNLTDDADKPTFLARFRDTTMKKRRRLMVTKEGQIGMAPCRARKGDVVAILFGSSVPVLLRQHEPPEAIGSPSDKEGTFEFLGECFVHGYMNGEILREVEGGRKQKQTFRIV